VIAGLAVLTVGGVIGAWGLGISGTAIARNFRRWLRAQQQPVVGFARKRTVPAKAATAVGGNGRKKEMATSSVAR